MINADDEVTLSYLIDPTFEITNTEGRPLTGGYIEVYLHGTRSKYYCYSDWNGSLHPFKIPLDSLGANIILASPAHSYDIYVYNKYDNLIMSRYNVVPATGDGTVIRDVVITSSDNSINVSSDRVDNFDLTLNTVDAEETWAHFSNTSLWTLAYNNSANHTLSNNLNLAEGELIPNINTVLPAGLYDFKIELAFKTIEGYEADVMQRTELQIKYGSNVLRSETFTFDGTLPESNEQTAWSGGLFKLPLDGGIKIVVKMRNVNDNAGFRANLKVSHLFIRKVG